jgi:hypothetical protein
MVYIDGVY